VARGLPIDHGAAPPLRPIRRLRWWIGVLLFGVTVINYMDRQTFSILSVFIKDQYHWTNSDYSFIVNAFQIAYTVMQTVCGRLLDLVGTRIGIAVSVGFYSVFGILTAASQGKYSFAFFRFFLGAGEATNNPGGAKAVSEWFPAQERAWAIALFNSGCAIGGAIAPFILLFLYEVFDNWRPAFLVVGISGFLWLAAWLWLYSPPEKHPRISPEELDYIRRGRSSSPSSGAGSPQVRWKKLLRYRQAWGIILGRFLLDPYWFFIVYWWGLYLKAQGFTPNQSALGFVPLFACSGLGNFCAGWLSSRLVARGWAPGRSRRTVLLLFGPSMVVVILSLLSDSYWIKLACFAYGTFAYTCCGTMFLTLPTDVFHTRAVATVMGMAGTSAGVSTMISTFLIGWVADYYSFTPVVIALGIVPSIATAVFVTMVRAGKQPDPDGILLKF
jgi:ACS family hexuronate transporter-like MFS transporter